MAHDPDLTPLFRQCINADLDPLVQYVLGAKTNSLDANENYKRHTGDHMMYIDDLTKEIREFGGNSFANAFRPDGVSYREIVGDVADKLDVEATENEAVAEVEKRILLKILADSVQKMSAAERAALEEEFRKAGVSGVSFAAGVPAAVLAAQLGAFMSGFVAYKVAVIVANAVARALLGRGLTFAANAALTRALGLVIGPIGWAITAIWTAVDLAGPAYRVTMPVVVHVAFLRQKKSFEGLGG